MMKSFRKFLTELQKANPVFTDRNKIDLGLPPRRPPKDDKGDGGKPKRGWEVELTEEYISPNFVDEQEVRDMLKSIGMEPPKDFEIKTIPNGKTENTATTIVIFGNQVLADKYAEAYFDEIIKWESCKRAELRLNGEWVEQYWKDY